jgi:hypothetical protein
MGGSLASQKKKMFVPIRNHYWSAQAPVQAVLSSQIKEILLGGKLIVDVGGGLNPWQHATELVDIRNSSNKESRPVRLVDIDSEPLPYGDKQVDFIYSRHTLEDLHNPLLLCREMNRVAKAGYIETPSPVAEFCRGVDAGNPPWRGYLHHRYSIWHENGTLYFLPKYPCIEYANAPEAVENQLSEMLNQNPVSWNTYFLWHGSFPFKMLRHGIDFMLQQEDSVLQVVERAVNNSIENTNKFASEHQLSGTVYTSDVSDQKLGYVLKKKIKHRKH